MKVKITGDGVTMDSSVLDVGVEIEVSEAEATHLVKCGVAEILEEVEEKPAKKTGGKKTGDKDGDNGEN